MGKWSEKELRQGNYLFKINKKQINHYFLNKWKTNIKIGVVSS